MAVTNKSILVGFFFLIGFTAVKAGATGQCRADSLSCMNQPIGNICNGNGACFPTEKLITGDYACECRTADSNGSGQCEGGALSCLHSATGSSCGLGTCVPTGTKMGGDFVCECQ